MVVMLEIVVVATGIIIASAADPRESLIGATMVNFLLFTTYGPPTFAYSLIYLVQVSLQLPPIFLIVQSTPANILILHHWSLLFCFILFIPQIFLICKYHEMLNIIRC